MITDRTGHELNISDLVFHHPAGPEKVVMQATIEDIDGLAVKIRYRLGWQWTNRLTLEYATSEKLLLWELEN